MEITVNNSKVAIYLDELLYGKNKIKEIVHKDIFQDKN